jgi:hypothetical protein
MSREGMSARALLAPALMVMLIALTASAAAARPVAPTPTSTCRQDNFSPASRTLAPTAVYRTSGTVTKPSAVVVHRPTRISASGSTLTLDFGKDVAGIVTLHFAGASDSRQSLGLAFSESRDYVGTSSDASEINDGAITAPVIGSGSYTMPANELRGGFRYLTLFLQSAGWVALDRVSLDFTAAPGNPRPSAYPNYFCSSDQLLNRIWYAGAYTVQLDTIDPAQGHVWPPPASGWDNSGVVGVGSSVLVDGAKRDRSVWPGDYGIAVPTAFASIGDVSAIRNGLTTLYQHQDPTGAMPYAGPGINFPGASSDAYSLWSLVATADYYLQTGDKGWLDGIWSQYQRAVQYALDKVDPNGLMFVSGTSDWAPSSTGETVEANALLYRVLETGAQLAAAENASSTASSYLTQAAQLKAEINSLLWDQAKGAYQDNGYTSSATSSPLHPQDGNSLAVWFGVADAQARARQVLTYLHGNWNQYGATAPEWNGNISPFPGSMEVYAHFAGGDDDGALALIRREWGYMLTSPKGTGSSFWEGYNSNGALAYNPYFPGGPAGSYTSLAHGWSTGPTGALTSDVLGIAPESPGGGTYHVIPHPGNLVWADGRLTMPAGAVVAAWRHARAGFVLTVTDRGAGTGGVIALPRFGADRVVYVNGVKAWNGTRFLGARGIEGADQNSTYIYFRGVAPGIRTFDWRTKP